METFDFRKSLIDIAKEDNSNLLTKVIAYYYPSLNFSSRENLFDSLLNRLKLISEDQNFDFNELLENLNNNEEIVNFDEYKGKDFRIKEIEISNLRGIPSVDENNPIPYGISLLDDNKEINNAIILANNGVGKSSVFAGLEMIFAQEIGEKKIRTLNADNLNIDDYNKYLQNVKNSNKPVCNVKTVDGDYNLENIVLKNDKLRTLLNPQSHFISEYDVIRNGQMTYYGNEENTIHNIVASSLGLDEYLSCLNIAEQIPSYRRSKETTAKNSIEREIKENSDKIKNSTVLIQSKEEELKKLKDEGENKLNINNTTKIGKLNKLLNKPFEFVSSFQPKEHIDAYKGHYSSYSSLNINKKANIEKEFLEAGHQLLHESDDCPFCKSSNLTLEEIKLNVEKRLEELNSINKLSNRISEGYKILSQNLLDALQNFANIFIKIETDRTEVSSLPELNQILNQEEKLYVKLAPIVNDDELFNHIETLNRKSIPNEEDFKRLANFVNENSNLLNEFENLNLEIATFLQERKNVIESEITKLKSNGETLTKEQLIVKLENEINELRIQIKTATERNAELQKDLIPATKTVEFVSQIKNEIDVFNNKLRVKVNQIVETNFAAFKEPLEEILNDYFKDDSNFHLKIELKETPYIIDGETFYSKIIAAEIIDKNRSDIKTTPDQYFNTFRYKLFSLMIGISIALAARKKYEVNLPLVIDDLFYGSDFKSKNTFAKFIQDIIILYYKHTPDLPLQIILFTHDNFIFKGALEGVDDLMLKHKEYNLEHTIKSRMFPPNDKEEETSVTGFKFWNLINS